MTTGQGLGPRVQPLPGLASLSSFAQRNRHCNHQRGPPWPENLPF